MDALVSQPSQSDGRGPGLVDHGQASPSGAARSPFKWVGAGLLLLGLASIAIPTMIYVAQESWSKEEGSHGPIVLFTGLWLLWRQWSEARALAAPPRALVAAPVLAASLVFYALARITQIVEVEGYAMYACLLAVLFGLVGTQAMKRMWFPLFYLVFIFPPPEMLVATVTLPMKTELSKAAVSFLDLLGYPIGGEGVMIYIGQYELLVAAACSGLNSIISLSAITLFYIYVRHQADWRYAALLVVLIVPVALLANFVRVLILILLTYHVGEAAAQGFLHNFAGVCMFAVALATIYLLDEAIRPVWVRLIRGRGEGPVAHG